MTVERLLLLLLFDQARLRVCRLRRCRWEVIPRLIPADSILMVVQGSPRLASIRAWIDSVSRGMNQARMKQGNLFPECGSGMIPPVTTMITIRVTLSLR